MLELPLSKPAVPEPEVQILTYACHLLISAIRLLHKCFNVFLRFQEIADETLSRKRIIRNTRITIGVFDRPKVEKP